MLDRITVRSELLPGVVHPARPVDDQLHELAGADEPVGQAGERRGEQLLIPVADHPRLKARAAALTHPLEVRLPPDVEMRPRPIERAQTIAA
jgi:hypothetical protein